MENRTVGKDICNILASGSSGNCEIYHRTIAVDMGVPYSVIAPYKNDLQLVLLTHIHADHFNIATIKKLAYERPTLRFGCGSWMLPLLNEIRNVDVYEFGQWYDYGQFRIATGKLYHDVENCFYRIEKNGHKIFRATDTFTLEGITAKEYDLFCVESNYDEDTVMQIIEEQEARGEFAHQRGSINSHLSEQQARDFFFKNRGEHSQMIRLHESRGY